jgi:hypothetical protein
LRDEFPPVSAGVEWHRDFTVGGGFTVQIDDPNDVHKKEMKDAIIKLCKGIFQDAYIKGLDSILDIMIEMALTDGLSAAEVLYGNETNFEDYVDGYEDVTVPDPKAITKTKVVQVMRPKEPDWAKLGTDKDGNKVGMTRLKIIEDSYRRLVPYRHPISGEVLFWTLDEKIESTTAWGTREMVEKNKQVIKFHTWEIFWLSWNKRGTNLKSRSIIEPVYIISKFVQAIQKAVGIGFNRWANKKYFLVCGTEKFQWSKPARQQFLKTFEQMVKNNWVGMPVPAGFDVKEMGGEQAIFEGKNLLDYLTGMICAGMQYPREFLEIGKSQQGNQAFLAWTVRYGRSQQMIRRAVEQQLWTRHLWCIFGKTHKISKKGVKVADQEMLDIYIPKMNWRSEGRWHEEAKVKELSGIMNWANPADAPLKLSLQKELAEVLGLGELDWTVIMDLFNTQSETRLMEAKITGIQTKAKLEVINEMSQDELKTLIKAQLMKPLENPQEATKPPQTEEQILTARAEKRAEGGVSRTSRDKGTAKGQSKEMGGTREPKLRMQETIDTGPLHETISLLPRDLAEKMVVSLETTEQYKREQLQVQTKKAQKELERYEKKIALLDKLEKRLKKKGKGDEDE